MIFKLGNTDYTNDIIQGDEKNVVNVDKKTDKKLQARSYSNELRVKGAAYDYLKAELIDHPNAKMNFVTFLMLDECCLDDDGNPHVALQGIVRADMISWCDFDCFIDFTSIEKTDDTNLYDCFKSTLIADDRNGFRSQNFPRVTYCNELRPDWFHDFVLIVGILLNLVLVIFSPIVFLLSLIVQVLCFIAGVIPGFNCPPGLQNGILDDYIAFIGNLNEIIVGCGRQHPTPLLRDYIQNVCDICGLSFQSSILNDPTSDYYNTLYFNAPVEKGTRDTGVKYIDINYPIHNGESLMEEIKGVFSADWTVRNGQLIFEHETWFWQGNIWVNLQQIIDEGRLEGKVCYTWRDENKYAYGRFEYSLDAVDVCGNEARERHNDIVEWNNPVNEIQNGEYSLRLAYGMTRYRGDGIDRDVLSTWQNAPFLSSVISQYDDVIIMDKGVAFQPKLLIWDGADINNARIKKYSIPNHDVPANQNFNFPYMFNETNVSPNTVYPTNQPNMGIYGRFHTYKNPKVSIDLGREFSFTFRYTCDELRTFDIYKNIAFPTLNGRMENVKFDYTNKTVTVNGNI